MQGPSHFRLHDPARHQTLRELGADYPDSSVLHKAYGQIGSVAASVHRSGDPEITLLAAARMIATGHALLEQVVAEDGGYRPAPKRPKKHVTPPAEDPAHD